MKTAIKKIAIVAILAAILLPSFMFVRVRAVNTDNILSIPARYYHAGRPVYEITENED